MHPFLHFFVIFLLLHVLTSLHLFLPFFMRSLRPSHRCTGEGVIGGGVDGGGGGGGGSPAHKPQVFLHLSFFASVYFLHLFGLQNLSVLAHGGWLGGGGVSLQKNRTRSRVGTAARPKKRAGGPASLRLHNVLLVAPSNPRGWRRGERCTA